MFVLTTCSIYKSQGIVISCKILSHPLAQTVRFKATCNFFWFSDFSGRCFSGYFPEKNLSPFIAVVIFLKKKSTLFMERDRQLKQ